MQKLFISFLNTISKLTDKRVIYYTGDYANENNLAVKTKFGFWYCGNILSYSDIAYGFANNGIIEESDMRIVETIIKHGSKTNPNYITYDIGSNTGPYSLLALTIAKNGKVYSFDPVKEHLDTLKQSILLNRYEERVELHEIGLSNKAGKDTLHLAGSGSTLEKDFIDKETPTRTVTLAPLDVYVAEKNISDPDFIKIDIEGHEYIALQGATTLLKKKKPVLFIEIALHLKGIGRDFTNKNFKATFELLEEIGYCAYIADNGTLEKITEAFDKDGVYMYLFLHKDKELKDTELCKALGIQEV